MIKWGFGSLAVCTVFYGVPRYRNYHKERDFHGASRLGEITPLDRDLPATEREIHTRVFLVNERSKNILLLKGGGKVFKDTIYTGFSGSEAGKPEKPPDQTRREYYSEIANNTIIDFSDGQLSCDDLILVGTAWIEKPDKKEKLLLYCGSVPDGPFLPMSDTQEICWREYPKSVPLHLMGKMDAKWLTHVVNLEEFQAEIQYNGHGNLYKHRIKQTRVLRRKKSGKRNHSFIPNRTKEEIDDIKAYAESKGMKWVEPKPRWFGRDNSNEATTWNGSKAKPKYIPKWDPDEGIREVSEQKPLFPFFPMRGNSG